MSAALASSWGLPLCYGFSRLDDMGRPLAADLAHVDDTLSPDACAFSLNLSAAAAALSRAIVTFL